MVRRRKTGEDAEGDDYGMKIVLNGNDLVCILDDLKNTKEWSESHPSSSFWDGYLHGMVRMLNHVVGNTYDIVWRADKNFYELQERKEDE